MTRSTPLVSRNEKLKRRELELEGRGGARVMGVGGSDPTQILRSGIYVRRLRVPR